MRFASAGRRSCTNRVRSHTPPVLPMWRAGSPATTRSTCPRSGSCWTTGGRRGESRAGGERGAALDLVEIKKMRVLITCVSGYGHIHPLLPLARALSDARHDVVMATGRELHPRVEAAGFETFDAGLAPGAAFERLAELFPDQVYNRLAPAEILGWYLPHLFGEAFAPALRGDLEPLVRSWRPDVVVHDAWEFAGPIAAAGAGIPSVSQTLGLRPD